MNSIRFLSGCLSLLFIANQGFSETKPGPEVELTPIYTNQKFENPVSMIIPDDGTKRRFLVEQTGKIKILDPDEAASESKVFMDLNDRMVVAHRFEEGLLGLAFHPSFKENGKFYVYYNKQGPKRTLLSEFHVDSSDPDKADLNSERILMEIQQPDWNHNSGNLFFGPEDGYLYVAVGDGGRRHGVFMLAQNKGRWNGKVLRIDVDSKSEGREYGIPADNPMVGDPNACPEIWALGLRNPWGGAFDEETGLFYLADVGQSAWEEVNIIKRGGNYGWAIREGNEEFSKRQALMDAIDQANKKPKGAKFIDPIHKYDHSRKGRSITGGFVYRGKAMPSLVGHFIFGDWRHSDMWALKYDPESDTTQNYIIYDPAVSEVQPSGYYPDEDGEPIVMGWRGGLYRMKLK